MRHVRFETVTPNPDCFFQKRDPWGHGSSLWVMAVLVFVAPLAIVSLTHVRLDNNIATWLPEDDPGALEYAWCRDHFPEQESVVLTWQGSTMDDPRLPVLTGRLQGTIDEDGIRRGGLPHVSSVVHAKDIWRRMTDQGIEPEEALRRMRGTFLGSARLLVQLTKSGRENPDQARRLIEDHLAASAGFPIDVSIPSVSWQPGSASEETFDQLLLQFSEPDEEHAAWTAPEHDIQVALPEHVLAHVSAEELETSLTSVVDAQGRAIVAECTTSPFTPIAVVVQLSDAGVAEKERTLSEIRRVAAESFIPEDQLIMGGQLVAGTELNSGVIKAAWNPSAKRWSQKSVIVLSGLVGIAFALLSLRSLRLGLLVVGVSYYAALLGVSIIPLTGGSMNMVLIVMPTLLMVLALSGAIHVANYWKHAVWENPENAVSQAIKMARQPCLMAAFTTSLGLISLSGSQLIPVRQFGIYAAIGSMISVGMVLYGLPSLLQMCPLRRVRPAEANSAFWNRFGIVICRWWKPLAGMSIATAIVCIIGLNGFQVETQVIRYFSKDSRVVQHYEQIEQTLAGITPVEVVVRFDDQMQEQTRFLERMEIVREIENQLRDHPEISGTVSLADFQPIREAPGEDARTRQKIFYNRRSSEAERQVKEREVDGAAEFLAVEQTAVTGGQIQRSELWRINAQAYALSNVDYTALTDDLSHCVASVADRYAGVDHLVTGTVPLFLRTQRAVLESLIWSSILAFGLIAVVMIWVLKDLFAGLISMIPNLLPVISVFGLVSWCGQQIDIGTMVTASVALGIAVDGTLHLITWFRDGLERGKSRQDSVLNALAHCGPAMWQTSAAVGLGLLVLFPAELLLISRFGWLMASLIGAALIGDLVLLPSLLVGPLGALIERKVKKSARNTLPLPDASPVITPVPAPHLAISKMPDEEPTRYVG